jgi:plasmid stabilization system protein ParE
MAKSKQHTPPSTHQLRQYVAGTLTPQDQHKVEKEALQNQQVDDTLEGLQAMKKAGVDESEALLDVRRRLQRRISPQKRRLVPYYYASAAAVVMAVGLGWWLVQRQDLPQSTVKTAAETVLPSAPVPESAPILAEKQTTLSAKSSPQRLARKPIQEQVAAAPPTQDALETEPAESSAASIIEEKKAEEVAAVVPAQELAAKPAQAKSRVASAPAAALPLDTFTLRGKILEEETREALAGSIITVKGRNRGTSSATDGTFFLRGVRPNDNVSIGAVGFTPVQITVKDSVLAPVLLKAEQNALSEVVVTGYNKRAQKPKVGQASKAYSDYIQGEIDAFLKQNPQSPRGRVVVAFTVNEQGELRDFENKNGANGQLFEEAVRILKQGEKWTPTYKKGKPQSERKTQAFRF